MQNWPPSDADPLLQAIQADPLSDEARLVYADWLEERGDLQAELIRLQCGPRDPGNPSAEETAAVARQKAHWLARLQTIGVQDLVVQRGFIEKVRLSGAGVLAQPWLLFRSAPALRGLLWQNLPDRQAAESLRKMFGWPFLGTLTGLDLSQNRLDGACVEVLAQAKLPQLATLKLAGNRLGGHGVHVLVGSPLLRTVTTLNLAGNGLSGQCYRDIALSPRGQALETLILDDNPAGDAGCSALAASLTMGRLRTLSLCGNEITHDGLRVMANARTLTALTSLNLSRNPLGAVGAAMLGSSSNFSKLTSLGLRDCELGSEGAQALAQSVHLRSLKSLDLYGNDIRSGAIALAASKNLGRMESLELGANDIDAAGARALAESPHLTHLTALRLTMNPLGQTRSLVERFGAALQT